MFKLVYTSSNYDIDLPPLREPYIAFVRFLFQAKGVGGGPKGVKPQRALRTVCCRGYTFFLHFIKAHK